jgi:hypothetical protein
MTARHVTPNLSQSAPRDITKEFAAQIAQNIDEYHREVAAAQQALSLVSPQEAEKVLDGIREKYVKHANELYYLKLQERYDWLSKFGGSSYHAPEIVMLLQAMLSILDRLDALEQRPR